MSIEVNKLSKQYGNQWAVSDISFNIPTGQVVGFLGPNGAGKSTTMKMLTCYITPTSGSAKISGLSVGQEDMAIRKQIGYLPEHNPLYFDMYVKEYLSFVANLCGITKNVSKHVSEMITRTGLEREQSKKIGTLSKGYKQRVGMAQALMNDPKVLILDEPTSGLDPNQITEIRRLIREIGEERTVLLSTHIMQEVEAMCSRVIIINEGKLVADDSIDKLQQQDISSKVIVVQFKTSISTQVLSAIAGIKSVENLPNNKYRITCKNDLNIQEKLFAFAVKTGNIILEQKEEEQSLEHVFRALTK
ncbi:MAG: ABC-2 type transport system ATP-binding protein [Bacteroidia bacterium]|jgi:ABC-2 type transport system ATP-binding protein